MKYGTTMHMYLIQIVYHTVLLFPPLLLQVRRGSGVGGPGQPARRARAPRARPLRRPRHGRGDGGNRPQHPVPDVHAAAGGPAVEPLESRHPLLWQLHSAVSLRGTETCSGVRSNASTRMLCLIVIRNRLEGRNARRIISLHSVPYITDYTSA